MNKNAKSVLIDNLRVTIIAMMQISTAKNANSAFTIFAVFLFG